jgi:hypothetical protein
MQNFFPGILSYFVSILAKYLIISFQYNIESVYFFYSNPVYIYIYLFIYLFTYALEMKVLFLLQVSLYQKQNQQKPPEV